MPTGHHMKIEQEEEIVSLLIAGMLREDICEFEGIAYRTLCHIVKRWRRVLKENGYKPKRGRRPSAQPSQTEPRGARP